MSTPHLRTPVGPADHSRGTADAEVTLVEYGDFECPYCGQAYPILKRVQERMGPSLRFVFRHFPIAELHRHAESAAEAAEAVSALNGAEGFWRMHDLLFEHQHALTYQDLAGYAEKAGVPAEIVLNDLDEGRYRGLVRESVVAGARSGVNGTPTLFIDGVRYDGPRDEETLVLVLGRLADHREVSHGR